MGLHSFLSLLFWSLFFEAVHNWPDFPRKAGAWPGSPAIIPLWFPVLLPCRSPGLSAGAVTVVSWSYPRDTTPVETFLLLQSGAGTAHRGGNFILEYCQGKKALRQKLFSSALKSWTSGRRRENYSPPWSWGLGARTLWFAHQVVWPLSKELPAPQHLHLFLLLLVRALPAELWLKAKPRLDLRSSPSRQRPPGRNHMASALGGCGDVPGGNTRMFWEDLKMFLGWGGRRNVGMFQRGAGML